MESEQQIHSTKRLKKLNNLALRFLQLGCQLFIGQLMSSIGNKKQKCQRGILTIIFIISLILIIANTIFLILIFLRRKYNQTRFHVILGFQIVLSGVVMILGFSQLVQNEKCPNARIFSQFVAIQSLITLVLCVIILCGPYYYAQRYPNSPGNLVWVLLFLGIGWQNSFKSLFLAIGIITLLVSLSSFIINLVVLLKGMRSTIKKLLYVQWIVCLILMGICCILAFIAYNTNIRMSGYNAEMGKTLIRVFIGVNISDIIFWAWGIYVIKDQKKMRHQIRKTQRQQYYEENDLDQFQFS